jgi:hypothetical protein
VALVDEPWIVGSDVKIEFIFGGVCWGGQIVGSAVT